MKRILVLVSIMILLTGLFAAERGAIMATEARAETMVRSAEVNVRVSDQLVKEFKSIEALEGVVRVFSEEGELINDKAINERIAEIQKAEMSPQDRREAFRKIQAETGVTIFAPVSKETKATKVKEKDIKAVDSKEKAFKLYTFEGDIVSDQNIIDQVNKIQAADMPPVEKDNSLQKIAREFGIIIMNF